MPRGYGKTIGYRLSWLRKIYTHAKPIEQLFPSIPDPVFYNIPLSLPYV